MERVMRDPIAISLASLALAGVGLLWRRMALWRRAQDEKLDARLKKLREEIDAGLKKLREHIEAEIEIRDGMMEGAIDGLPEKFARAMTRRLEREALGLGRPRRGMDGRH